MKRSTILCLALLAAACTEDAAAPATEQGGEAAGEVLGGSISDDMIPLEQLGSESPLMPRQSAAPGASDDTAADAADGEDAGTSEGAEAAPPAAPTPDAPAIAE
ncbi:hypothetical protein [Erythrobacter sp.]|uniref:hypothetical protein n=1 Tax=Erythrobacter sp. TaxID=1042 RepID=UPI0025FADEDD|nr:hypothetical protein [Erythrobacter sp.]